MFFFFKITVITTVNKLHLSQYKYNKSMRINNDTLPTSCCFLLRFTPELMAGEPEDAAVRRKVVWSDPHLITSTLH